MIRFDTSKSAPQGPHTFVVLGTRRVPHSRATRPMHSACGLCQEPSHDFTFTTQALLATKLSLRPSSLLWTVLLEQPFPGLEKKIGHLHCTQLTWVWSYVSYCPPAPPKKIPVWTALDRINPLYWRLFTLFSSVRFLPHPALFLCLGAIFCSAQDWLLALLQGPFVLSRIKPRLTTCNPTYCTLSNPYIIGGLFFLLFICFLFF